MRRPPTTLLNSQHNGMDTIHTVHTHKTQNTKAAVRLLSREYSTFRCVSCLVSTVPSARKEPNRSTRSPRGASTILHAAFSRSLCLLTGHDGAGEGRRLEVRQRVDGRACGILFG
jgi:hypothetical protein